MASSTVSVQFSASIKNLIDATNQVKGAIDSVAEQAKAANEALSKFGEFAIAGVSLEGIKTFVESMAELGERAEKMSHMLGVSTTGVQELGYVAKMTGTDADSMANAMARFQLAIAKAQNPISQQAAALRAFGLSAKDLIGLPLDIQMAKFADAVSKFADGTNKTAAIGALNRALVGMIPLLDEGGAGFAKLRQHAEDTGTVMSGQTIAALSKLDHALIGAKTSLTTFGGELVSLASGPLINFANQLATDTGNMTALIESGKLGTYMLADLKLNLELVTMRMVQFGEAQARLLSGHIGGLIDDWKAWQTKIDETTKAGVAGLDALQAKATQAYKQILAANNEGENGVKPQVKPVDVNRGNEAGARMSALNAELQLEDKNYQQQVAHLNALQKAGIVTEQQKTHALISAVNQREDAELAEIARVRAAGNLSAQQYQELENKKTAVIQAAVAQRQSLTDKQYDAEVATAKKAADAIASAFNAQLQSILQGHETFTQGMEKMFGAMIEMMIAKLVTLIAEWAVLNALAAATGGTGPTLMSLIMPSHAAGAWNLGGDEIAQLHKNEMVIPAGPAESIRSAMGGSQIGRFSEMARGFAGGNSSSNVDSRQVHVHYDGRNIGIQDHAREIAKAVSDHWASNPSTRPAY